jgi:hypothetical protein
MGKHNLDRKRKRERVIYNQIFNERERKNTKRKIEKSSINGKREREREREKERERERERENEIKK